MRLRDSIVCNMHQFVMIAILAIIFTCSPTFIWSVSPQKSPQFITPTNGITLPLANVLIRWTVVSGADSYAIGVRNLTNNVIIVNQENIQKKTYYILDKSKLIAGNQYKVAVGAIGNDGIEQWTDNTGISVIFQVAGNSPTPPVAVTTPQPSNNTPKLKDILVNADHISLIVGENAQFTSKIKITAQFSDNSTKDITWTNDYQFKMNNTAIAQAPKNGTMVGIREGNTELVITYQDKQKIIPVVVTAKTQANIPTPPVIVPTPQPSNNTPKLIDILVNTEQISLIVGEKVPFTSKIKITAQFNDNSTKDITWTNDYLFKMKNTMIAQAPGNGTMVGIREGNTELVITYLDKQKIVPVVVTATIGTNPNTPPVTVPTQQTNNNTPPTTGTPTMQTTGSSIISVNGLPDTTTVIMGSRPILSGTFQCTKQIVGILLTVHGWSGSPNAPFTVYRVNPHTTMVDLKKVILTTTQRPFTTPGDYHITIEMQPEGEKIQTVGEFTLRVTGIPNTPPITVPTPQTNNDTLPTTGTPTVQTTGLSIISVNGLPDTMTVTMGSRPILSGTFQCTKQIVGILLTVNGWSGSPNAPFTVYRVNPHTTMVDLKKVILTTNQRPFTTPGDYHIIIGMQPEGEKIQTVGEFTLRVSIPTTPQSVGNDIPVKVPDNFPVVQEITDNDFSVLYNQQNDCVEAVVNFGSKQLPTNSGFYLIIKDGNKILYRGDDYTKLTFNASPQNWLNKYYANWSVSSILPTGRGKSYQCSIIAKGDGVKNSITNKVISIPQVKPVNNNVYDNSKIGDKIASIAKQKYGNITTPGSQCLNGVQNILDEAGIKTIRVASAYLFPTTGIAGTDFLNYYSEVNNLNNIDINTLSNGAICVYESGPGHRDGHIEIKTDIGFISDYRHIDRKLYYGHKPFHVYIPNGTILNNGSMPIETPVNVPDADTSPVTQVQSHTNVKAFDFVEARYLSENIKYPKGSPLRKYDAFYVSVRVSESAMVASSPQIPRVCVRIYLEAGRQLLTTIYLYQTHTVSTKDTACSFEEYIFVDNGQGLPREKNLLFSFMIANDTNTETFCNAPVKAPNQILQQTVSSNEIQKNPQNSPVNITNSNSLADPKCFQTIMEEMGRKYRARPKKSDILGREERYVSKYKGSNWFGAEWSGGQNIAAKELGNLDVPPINIVDETAKLHDTLCYLGFKNAEHKSLWWLTTNFPIEDVKKMTDITSKRYKKALLPTGCSYEEAIQIIQDSDEIINYHLFKKSAESHILDMGNVDEISENLNQDLYIYINQCVAFNKLDNIYQLARYKHGPFVNTPDLRPDFAYLSYLTLNSKVKWVFDNKYLPLKSAVIIYNLKHDIVSLF